MRPLKIEDAFCSHKDNKLYFNGELVTGLMDGVAVELKNRVLRVTLQNTATHSHKLFQDFNKQHKVKFKQYKTNINLTAELMCIDAKMSQEVTGISFYFVTELEGIDFGS